MFALDVWRDVNEYIAEVLMKSVSYLTSSLESEFVLAIAMGHIACGFNISCKM